MAQSVQLNIGSHAVVVTPNGAGGFDLTHATGGRFLELNDGGGHLELRKPGSLAPDNGLEVGEDGRVVVHDA